MQTKILRFKQKNNTITKTRNPHKKYIQQSGSHKVGWRDSRRDYNTSIEVILEIS